MVTWVKTRLHMYSTLTAISINFEFSVYNLQSRYLQIYNNIDKRDVRNHLYSEKIVFWLDIS